MEGKLIWFIVCGVLVSKGYMPCLYIYSCVLLYVLVTPGYVINRGGAFAGGSDSNRNRPPAAFTRDSEYVKVAVDSQ